jgi:formylglycine-generating enzyme required for sulfatase activity
MTKYNNVCVDWQKEIKDYEKYLDANGGGAPAYHNFDNRAEVVLTPSETRAKPVLPAKETVQHKDRTSDKFPFGLETAHAMQSKLGKTTLEIDLGQGIKMKLKRIPAGEFVMGSLEGAPDEAPLSKISISKPYWIGKCEVANEQYATIFPKHDSRFTDQQWKDHINEGYPSNRPKQPVIRVSWEEALAFCKALSKKTGLKISLPTEAQWEWVARAGSAQAFSFGDLDVNFASYANLADDKQMIAGDGGHYKPNSWGALG